MSDPCDLSAVELRRLIGAKQLSPRELLASCRRRIERVNGTVNAVVAFDEAGAEEAAAAAEQAVMRGDPLGPLHGLPLGIKDLNETAGLRTTHGSLVFQDSVPKADGPIHRVALAGAAIGRALDPPAPTLWVSEDRAARARDVPYWGYRCVSNAADIAIHRQAASETVDDARK